jgi:periplasmic protein TonB
MGLTFRLLVVWFVLGAGVALGSAQQVFEPGNGVSLPAVVREVKPQYTPEARAAKIQGTVLLETVVLSDGTVGDTKVVQSLDTKFGLDNQAIKAAQQWKFKPGMKDGQPVAVRIAIELTFTLK